MKATKTLQKAIEAGYVVCRGYSQKSYLRVSNPYFHWCERSGRPFVRISANRKYATVELDLIGNTFHLNQAGMERLLQLIPDRYAKALDGCGPVLSMYSRVPLANAEEVARAMSVTASNPFYQEPNSTSPVHWTDAP